MSTSLPAVPSSRWLHAALVALLGLLASVVLYREQDARLTAIEQARFEQQATQIYQALQQRLANDTEVVYGLRGLFVANPALTRAQFQRVAEELAAGSRTPGLVNLSFTRRVAQADREAFEQQVRADRSLWADGNPGFAIHPSAPRSEYFVADFLWPLQGNEALLGFDISSQPANLEAMHYARDTGQVVMSAPFTLLQETLAHPGPGIVIRVPVFDAMRAEGDPAAGRNFLGAVAMTVNVRELMQAIESKSGNEDMDIELHDLGTRGGKSGAGEAGMFFHGGHGRALDHLRPAQRELVVHNRLWRLDFRPTERFLSPPETRLPLNSALVGAALVLLLGTVFSLLSQQRRIALLRARHSAAALISSEGRFLALFNQAAVGVALVDAETEQLTEINQRFCAIVGSDRTALRGRALSELFQPGADAERAQAQMQELRRMQGGEFSMELPLAAPRDAAAGTAAPQPRWVARTISAMRPEHGEGAATHAIVVLHDITARHAMEEALRRNESRLRALLQQLPVGVLLLERDGAVTLCNQRFTELTGYSESDLPDGQTWWQKAYPDAEYRARLQEDWHLATRKAYHEGAAIPSGEFTVVGADQQSRTMEIAGVWVGTQLLVTFVDLSQRKAAEQEIRTLAYYDLLTALPNRRLLVNRLEQSLKHCKPPSHCALLMLDLDNFKALNDTRGHERGDQLLKLVAERLLACVRSDDTVARPGGDEFAVLLENVGDSMEAARRHCDEIGQKILASLREPYVMDGESHHSTLSMGVTVFSANEDSVDALLQRVDLAMYQAKAAGRDTLCFYDPSMHAQASERAALEVDMRAGLALDQFELYYQPQVDHGRIIAAEALLRWHHPQRGFVSPASFIPMAEETGLILPLGQWVLEAACRQLAQWADDPQLAELSLAVNVSPRQFRQMGFVQQVLATLASTGAAARRLKLELTEGLLLHDVDDCVARMSELKSYGVGFSLDDFGTGYSSLSYLKRLPLDQLKIDQSFVRDVLTDPNDASIVRTILALGSSLGLQVVAEGVETQEQQAFLERHHCHAWQGYLLSRPVPAQEFAALVRAHGAAKR
ncbi:EAL domain-containing protein [Simplicispira suum]|uniref:Bifunctional diguanylate cyclase/phosphodiesterase n=1 Tax=Simplicispira suum TaxID=2109915 RepID=A0A2S0N379_9BURK|nr:EAL domain-containing protein [Simplicispira suum]AVO42600.1 bifunctional diguanylate cyclase/phosphodiesterase [Simplicispira suum]